MSKNCVVITQPTYLPWIGYFEQLARADVFVFLDNVQFVRRSWHSRNKLKDPSDRTFWLTVPVVKQCRDTRIADILLSEDSDWRSEHLNDLKVCLSEGKFFNDIYELISVSLLETHSRLADLNISIIKSVARLLDLNPTFIRASELQTHGRRSELLLDICQTVAATDYYSAVGSKTYMQSDLHLFERNGIRVEFQDWVHPTYSQQGNEFVSHLSIVDAIANVGPTETRKFLFEAKS